ncbi:hypothetical protein KIV56_09840 [Cryobacterium breve]|uniref:Uncharacterized protein n=1 Tax=Cryobacterium breve TaxID=1259258 RepID=A0ABY7NBF3_9MICO|nr:hypothetical protein [Cryobacterium breve]WBM78893.1 hypothetical protein KIV56_09840 [Cryobacterium breve]
MSTSWPSEPIATSLHNGAVGGSCHGHRKLRARRRGRRDLQHEGGRGVLCCPRFRVGVGAGIGGEPDRQAEGEREDQAGCAARARPRHGWLALA